MEAKSNVVLDATSMKNINAFSAERELDRIAQELGIEDFYGGFRRDLFK